MTTARPSVGDALVVDGVTKRFAGVVAVDDVSFRVGAGETLGVIGPNGAGKTTLMNLLSRVYRADAGRILLMGADVTRLAAHRLPARGLSRTFQHAALIPELSVVENLMLAARGDEGAARARAEEVLRTFELTHLRWQLAGALAHGVKKRVEVARALVPRPSLVLLDEPFAGMSAREKEEMVECIEEVRASFAAAFLVVEHDVGVVARLAARVIVLHFGKLIADGPAQAVFARPDVAAAYFGRAV